VTLECLERFRQRGVIGYVNLELQEPGKGSQETFGLTQGQAVDRTYGQGCLDGRV
jgi:hypothetical protein